MLRVSYISQYNAGREFDLAVLNNTLKSMQYTVE